MVTLFFPAGTVNRLTGLVEVEREIPGEGPLVLEPHTVRFWCRHTKELKGSQVKKAELFVEYDCIQYVGNNRFICLPLNTETEFTFIDRVLKKRAYKADYNSSEYLIEQTSEKTFECNCQGWQTRARKGEIVPEGANCSHVLGLFFAFKLKRFAPRQKTMEVPGGLVAEVPGV